MRFGILLGLVPLPLALGTAPHRPRPVASGAHAAETGRIEGHVVISSTLSARRPRFRIYADVGPGSLPPQQAAADSLAEMRNVVVYVESERLGGDSSARGLPHRIAQMNEHFVPHVLPIVRGMSVDFPNEDDVYHNVFSLSSAATFDLGRYPRGSSKSWTFNRAGTVQVFCHIHSDMSAIILVLDNPYFATPASDGHFVIDDVPVGDYSVVGWHERVRPISRRVHVAAGQTTRIDFDIPLPPPPGSGSRP